MAIYGGAAGGGKTWALLLEPLRHIGNPNFGAVVFRRSYPQIMKEGGIWDETSRLYPSLRAESSGLTWTFPSGARIACAHMQYEKTLNDWLGAQIPLILIDQCEQFTEKQWFGILGRNRSMCGIRPYARATCNPAPGSWLSKFLLWWIDQETGYPIEERSGVIRWYARVDNLIVWANNREDLEGYDPTSFTFVPAKLSDNEAMAKADPGYKARLMALPRVERSRLLGGNWKEVLDNAVFATSAFRLVEAPPAGVRLRMVRYWDKAATPGGGAYTAGVLMGRTDDGRYWVLDVVRGQWSAGERDRIILQTAQLDRLRGHVIHWFEQEPGSGGKESGENSIRLLAGFEVYVETVSGKGAKITRAMPYSSQVEAGNVSVLIADWTDAYVGELAAFPSGSYMDQVDASSGAFNRLAAMPVLNDEGEIGSGGGRAWNF